MMQLPAEFRATLESYRGPLDLLLYLIKKEELDIFDIPISRITEQYLEYLQILGSIDPNICGEFLVLAAQLMEIKSRTLLPVDTPLDEDGEELEDPRLELVLQLLEYKKYKERALLLEHLVEQHNQKYRRPSQDLGDLLAADAGPASIGNVSVWDLLTAFHRVQLAVRQRQPHRILFEDRPIEEYVAEIRAAFENGRADAKGWVPFESLFDRAENKYDAVGFLLAILEMAKQGELRFHQEEVFGPIFLEHVPESEREPVVAEEPAADEQ